MRKLWAVILQTSAARIFSLLVGVVVLFITARWLGPDGRGTVAAITTWVGLFATFGSLSLGQVAIHSLAADRARERLGAILGGLLLVLAVVSLGGWLIAGAASWLRPGSFLPDLRPLLMVAGFAMLPFLILDQYSAALLTALNQLRVYNRYLVIGRSVVLVCVLAFVGLLGAGVIGVLLATLTGQVLVAAGALVFLAGHVRKAGQAIRIDKPELRKLLEGGVKLHPSTVGTFLFSSADILILHYYRGPAETGQYQLAAQLISVLIVVPQAASLVLFGSIAAKGPDRAWDENWRLLKHAMALMTVLAVVAGLSAPWWIVLLAGHEFAPSARLFQWLLLSVPGMTFSLLLAPQWIGRGFFLHASILTVAVGLLNVGANLYLVPLYGAMGAVVSNIATFMFSVIGNGVMAVYCARRAKLGVRAQ